MVASIDDVKNAVDKQLAPISEAKDKHAKELDGKVQRVQNFPVSRGTPNSYWAIIYAFIEMFGSAGGSFLTYQEDGVRLVGAQKSTMNAVSGISTSAQQIINSDKGSIKAAIDKLDEVKQ